ncbi:MAG: helix-turn-helix domain-containing protein [Sedimentitalea sp.]|uniref:helix-turn-helix domain-containing protein n=1 Tax=Sedimentitalea sp. TaxID=2048915 RepID=UPI0032669307
MLTWSTDQYRSADRFDLRREAVNATHLAWQLDRANEGFRGAEVQSLDSGISTFVNCRCDPCAGYRDARMTKVDGGERYGILALHKGRERVRQDDWSIEMHPGDVLIWDAGRPIEFEVMERIEKSTLLLCKDQLAELSGATTLPTGRLETARGFGALFANRIRTVSEQIADFAGAGTPQLGLTLVRDLLNAVGNIRPIEVVSARQVLRERAERMIEARFQDAGLSPSVLAEDMGLSVRALNRAFENSGTTVATKIRERRLHSAKSDLDNLDMQQCSVTQICLTRGFSSVEHFSRCFRAAFDMSPRAYRMRAHHNTGT